MDFRPLWRHRDYRASYSAQFVSFLGSMVTYVALPYQIFKLTARRWPWACSAWRRRPRVRAHPNEGLAAELELQS
jgi:hypothetical protein